MDEKRRLLNVLSRERVDRVPVICPGGMMSAAVTEVLFDVQANHFADAEAMAQTARNVRERIGFEDLGVPFDMTVEAEELGASVDLGSRTIEARVTGYLDEPLRDAVARWRAGDIRTVRSPAVIEAIKKLKDDASPVIGNITGPVSVLTSVYEPIDIFRLYRRDPEMIRAALAAVTDYIKHFAREMVRAGADVIAMCDPTSTGEILGAKNFAEFSVPLYREIALETHREGAPLILHICGDAGKVISLMDETGADALSFDSIVSVQRAKAEAKTPIMGNVSTLLLASGRPEGIANATRGAIDKGVDIAAPACGIGMETSILNLQAMIEEARRER